jgi:L-asparaginase
MMQRPRVLVLYTGGTIAMSVRAGTNFTDLSGALDLVALIPELASLAELETRALFHHDSADLGPRDWVILAEAIHAAFTDGVQGVVVAHGTDTMAYGASFVSFLLGPLPGPVVFTGAQRPLREVRSDARSNLIDAVLVATMAVPEVVIAFDSNVYRAVRTTKLDAWGYQAFDSPSAPPLVRLGLDVSIGAVRAPATLAPLDTRFEPKVLFMRVFPGLDPELVSGAMRLGARGLVLATYGTGTLPSRDGSLLPALREARERGVPVLVVSQCPKGHIDLSRYEGGVLASGLGAIGGRDMTIEAGLAKMMIGCARYSDEESVRHYLQESVLGESTQPASATSLA